MNQFSPFELLTREQSYLYFNDQFIPGVQTADYTIPENNGALNYIGQRAGISVLNRNQFPQLNVQSQIIGYDKIYPLLGTSAINAFIFKDKLNPYDGVQLLHGVIESYGQSCAIGQVPEISAQCSFYGNCGTLDLVSNPYSIPNYNTLETQIQTIIDSDPADTDSSIRISGPGSIEISTNQDTRSFRLLNNSSVLSYSFNLQYDWRPNFGLGPTIYPFSIDLKKPVSFSIQFDLDLQNIEATDIQDFYNTKEISDLTITLKDHITNITINQYRFSRIELSSQRSRFSQSDSARGTFEFYGSIF